MPISPQARRRLRPRSRAKATWARRASGLAILCADLLEDLDVQITLGQRILRHLFTTQHAVRAAFSSETLAAVEQVIREGEQAHGGQLRFVVEGGLDGPPLWQGQPARERAVDLFSQLRIWNTEHNCGVLIYVLFADRAVEIMADGAIHACCGDQAWREVCVEMQSQFTEGLLAEGSLAGVRAVGELLARHSPGPVPQTNELPDRPLLL